MKRVLLLILILSMSLGVIGCGEKQNMEEIIPEFEEQQENSLSEAITNVPEKKEEKPEEVLWQYLEDMINGDLLSAVQHTCYDMEEIYEDLVIERCRSLGISKQELYERIQSNLDNRNVNNYLSFMSAVEDYYKINMPQEQLEDSKKTLQLYKKEYEIINSSTQDIKNFLNDLGEYAEDFNEFYIPYLTSDSTTQYKKIYVPEKTLKEHFGLTGLSQNNSNKDRLLNLNQTNNEAQDSVAIQEGSSNFFETFYKSTFTRFLKKTENGWKLIDPGVLGFIISLLQEI